MYLNLETIPISLTNIHTTCIQPYTTGLSKEQLHNIYETTKSLEDYNSPVCIKLSDPLSGKAVCRFLLLPIQSDISEGIMLGTLNKREIFKGIQNGLAIPSILSKHDNTDYDYVVLTVGAVDGKLAARCLRQLDEECSQYLIPIHNSGVFRVLNPFILPPTFGLDTRSECSRTCYNANKVIKSLYREDIFNAILDCFSMIMYLCAVTTCFGSTILIHIAISSDFQLGKAIVIFSTVLLWLILSI